MSGVSEVDLHYSQPAPFALAKVKLRANRVGSNQLESGHLELHRALWGERLVLKIVTVEKNRTSNPGDTGHAHMFVGSQIGIGDQTHCTTVHMMENTWEVQLPPLGKGQAARIVGCGKQLAWAHQAIHLSTGSN